MSPLDYVTSDLSDYYYELERWENDGGRVSN